jgi:hypothetical protein
VAIITATGTAVGANIDTWPVLDHTNGITEQPNQFTLTGAPVTVTVNGSGHMTETPTTTYTGSFTYSGGIPSGTITGINYGFQSLGTIVSISGLSINASTYNAFAATGDTLGFLAQVLAPGSVFIASGAGDQIGFLGSNNVGFLAAGGGLQTDSLSALPGTSNNVAAANAPLLQTSLSGNPLTSATITVGGAKSNLAGMDTIRYVDGSVYYGPHTPGAEVYRLYGAALNRAPDPAGLGSFSQSIVAGNSLESVAKTITDSAEFKSGLGALSNSDFVKIEYQNVLGRSADSAGFTAFTGALDTGALTRAQVLVDFSESNEYVNDTASKISAGIFAPDPTAINVLAYYQATFNRLPDAPGLTSWVQERDVGLSESTMSQDFFNSPEAQARYANTSNTQFVNDLYQNALGRTGEAAGVNSWVNLLNTGVESRAQVLSGFADSAELANRLVPDFAAGIKTA